MTENRKASYTAAESIPIKLLLNPGVLELKPIHVQWVPTNHCNLHCKFCSCENRDRSLQMDMPTTRGVIEELASMGCLAVTVTGGGEPLCHPQITEMIECFVDNGIEVGLVTNGPLLSRMSAEVLSLLTWCRISNSDEREMSPRYKNVLERAVEADVDWAFSHVVSSTPNLEEIGRIVDFANEHNFTHVRLVADLLEPENVDMAPVRESLAGKDGIVIYQDRQAWEPGGPCLIGFIKPLIWPDFQIYPCCGVQYAYDPMPLDMPPSMSMGDARNLQEVYADRRPILHGCTRCYYMNYNRILEAVSGIKHGAFV